MTKQFPWAEVEAFASELATAAPGADVEQAVGVWLAEQVDFRELVPGPLGQLLEAVDDQLAKAGLLSKFVKLAKGIHPFRRKANAGN